MTTQEEIIRYEQSARALAERLDDEARINLLVALLMKRRVDGLNGRFRPALSPPK